MFDYNPELKTYINWRYVGLAVDPTEFQFSAITPTVFSEKVYSWKLFEKLILFLLIYELKKLL